jgi:hypothetical protein
MATIRVSVLTEGLAPAGRLQARGRILPDCPLELSAQRFASIVSGGNRPGPDTWVRQICQAFRMPIAEKIQMQLNTKAFALAFGILWGLGIFFLTWWIIAFDGATGEPTLIAKLYRGYSISPLGSVIGLVWGFFDGLFGGAIFAWLYNKIVAYSD